MARAKKDAPETGKPDVDKQQAEEADAKAEAEEKADETANPGDEKTQKRSKRRGSAETTTEETKSSPQARPAPRSEDGAIEVRARARYVRHAPRKARLVMDHIRGKRVPDALALLAHTPRAAAKDIDKLLRSAVANAENNFELDPGELRVGTAFVDEGPTLKRYRPRALGRATPIHKRTSHMTITLTGEFEE